MKYINHNRAIYAILAGVCLLVSTNSNAGAPTKVPICHVPPNTTDNKRIIRVNEAGTAVADHLAHGDELVSPEVWDTNHDNNCDGIPVDEDDISDGITPGTICDQTNATCINPHPAKLARADTG